MDYSRDRDVVEIVTGPQRNNNSGDIWGSNPSLDQSMWATEDEYGAWTREKSVDARSGSEPPNKIARGSQSADSRSKAIGKMFFKTKLCCKFRAGTCPYITNCNFAHSVEELRRPPPNWQDIVAGNDEEKEMKERETREEFQIPSVVSVPFGVDSQRSYKGRNCKKFFTEEGCPYGENCTFLHDEQSKTRESVAISLGPGSGRNYGNNNDDSSNNVVGVNIKPSNWKTRICNKWELTGYCPFGSKCHFAHGAQELHHYGGGLVETEAGDSVSAAATEVPSKNPTETTVASLTSVPYADSHHVTGVPSQRVSNAVIPRTGLRAHRKWKGPDKISLIYGDWIDDVADLSHPNTKE